MALADEQRESSGEKSRGFFLIGLGVGAVLIALALLFGGPTTKVVVTLVVVTTLLGAWRGAMETGAFVVALLVAAIAAFPLGRAIEGMVGSTLGLGGMAKYGAAVGIAALGVLVITALIVSVLAKRLKKKIPEIAKFDRPVGATLGLLEGVLLSFLVIWGALAIQPTAQRRVDDSIAAREAGVISDEPNLSERLAHSVLTLADDATAHPVGTIAASTNPFSEAEAFVLAEDYLLIANDPEAMRTFQESDAMNRVREHPAVKRTVEILENDPRIRETLEGGLTRDGLYAIINSDPLLDALRETNVLEEIKPLTDDLREALEEAKSRIRDE